MLSAWDGEKVLLQNRICKQKIHRKLNSKMKEKFYSYFLGSNPSKRFNQCCTANCSGLVCRNCAAELCGVLQATTTREPLYLNSLESWNCTVALGPSNDQVNIQEISFILGQILLWIQLPLYVQRDGNYLLNDLNFKPLGWVNKYFSVF